MFREHPLRIVEVVTERIQLDLPIADRPIPNPKPIIKWAGGKRIILAELLKLLPAPTGRYIEPFLGGGAVFLGVRPSAAIVGDSNEELIDLYEAVRSEPEYVMLELDRLQAYVQDRAFYYGLRAVNPNALPPSARAARFIFLNKTGYNGLYRVNRAGRFNVPFGSRPAPPSLYSRANICAVSCALQTAELRCGDFEPLMDMAGDGDVVYVDPPYAPMSATANFTSYTSSGFGPDDQRRLAAAVRRAVVRGAHVVASNSDVPLIRELYADFEIVEIRVPRRINSDSTGRNKILELAITAATKPTAPPTN